MSLWVKLKILTGQWKIWYGRKNRLFRIGLPLLLVCLISAVCLLTVGPARMGLILSGDRAVYENLPVLWDDDPLKIHIIDVGQGDASLIQTKGHSILIDAGPPDQALALLGYLKALGIAKLDLMILTHPHDDHLGGAPLLMDRLTIGGLLIAHEDKDNVLQQQISALARQKMIPVSHPYRGSRIQSGELSMECLHPLPEAYANINNYSSVWQLAFRDTRWLFLADLEKDEFTSLPLDQWDFIRAGHHGSATSFDERLFTQIAPRLVAISCGLNNSFGHPDKALLRWLEGTQLAYFRTDRSGTRVITTDGKSLRWVH